MGVDIDDEEVEGGLVLAWKNFDPIKGELLCLLVVEYVDEEAEERDDAWDCLAKEKPGFKSSLLLLLVSILLVKSKVSIFSSRAPKSNTELEEWVEEKESSLDCGKKLLVFRERVPSLSGVSVMGIRPGEFIATESGVESIISKKKRVVKLRGWRLTLNTKGLV